MRPAARSAVQDGASGRDRAIAPPIGIAVLLVVAVVVASLVGVAATQLVTGETEPPRATVFVGTCQTPDGDSVFKLQHHGGDVIDTERASLQYRDVAWQYTPEQGPDTSTNGTVSGRLDLEGDRLTPGDVVLLGHTVVDLDFAGGTVQLVWNDGASGYVLAQWQGGDGGFDGLGSGHCPFPPSGSTSNTRGYNVSIGECEWTPGADDSGKGNQCSSDADDPDNPGR